jgi:hypothetical protein
MKIKLTHVAALAAFALFASGYGCAQEEAPAEEQSEDELGLRRGSVDHAAIVESTTMMLAGQPLDGQLDPYNQADPFAIRGAFEATFARRLADFDAYDGKADWRPEQASAWAARMGSGNYLVVDTSKPCDFARPRSYLEIERAQLSGRAHETCGGRNPNEDALDVTLNFLVRGPGASAADEGALHDGVDAPTKLATDTFPYLAEMNGI